MSESSVQLRIHLSRHDKWAKSTKGGYMKVKPLARHTTLREAFRSLSPYMEYNDTSSVEDTPITLFFTTAVKRLMKEAQELREPTEQYHAQPLEDNLFEWHFTIRGPGDSEFEEGLYHGRIVLPPDYPMKPPSIILLTPNGRFEVNKKICLSISGYHPESWQPSWSIRTALLAIIGFMPTHGAGAIGSLDYSAQERKVLAKKSQSWQCQSCGDISNVLHQVTDASKETSKEAKQLASQISFQAEKEKKSSEDSGGGVDSSGQPPDSPSAECSKQAEASYPSPPHTQSLPSSPPNNSFLFPFPPNLADQWHNSSHHTATTTTWPNFPLPFVAPPFRPAFPPLHFLPGHPAEFPPGWQPPGLPTGFPTTSSAYSPSGQSGTPSASVPTPASASASERASSQLGTSPRADNSSSTEQPRPTTFPPVPSSTVRQRHPQNPSAVPSQMRNAVNASAAQTSEGAASLLLVTVLGLVIGLLLLRRFYMMNV